MTNTVARVAWEYDARGRVTREWRTVMGVITGTQTRYGYDALDRVITTSYPSGEVVTTTYDAGGRPSGLTTSLTPGTYASGAVYNALGHLTWLNLGNGLTQHSNYWGLEYTYPGSRRTPTMGGCGASA
jgi:YD repeat-containing protein